jgi:hypothetical protein
MNKSCRTLAAAAGLALTAAAVAQPASTDLGTLSAGAVNVPNISLGAGQIIWYQFTLTQEIPAGGTLYLDIDSEGSFLAPSNDTELGLYDSFGNRIADDDDSGSNLLSQLSFGSTITRPPVGTGAAYNGRNGGLAAGTYYLALGAFNTTFNPTNWDVTSTSGNSGTANLNLVLGEVIGGACCMPDGSCSINSADGCANAGGSYAGDNTVCSQATCPSGACCMPDGSCVIQSPSGCTGMGGVYGGDGSDCGTANCPQPPGQYAEPGDAGDLPATAAVTTGTDPLTYILGTLTLGDADMYKIQVCDAGNFSATSVGGTTVDTVMCIFRADGTGVAFDDDEVDGTSLQSRITNQFVAPAGNGVYYLAVAQFNKLPQSGGENIWINDGITNPYRSERAPDGPGAFGAVDGWVSSAGGGGPYRLALTGACFAETGGGSTCYANCDGSTQVPFLNVLDFNCFLNQFTSGTSYANCDNSTQAPVLNVLDFNCFLNKFTTGCTAP